MKSDIENSQWIKGMKKKVEEEMTKKEIESLLYWKAELEKVFTKKHESLGSFQIEIQQYVQRLQNRIKVLKSSLPDA
jgi:hypothetical protein